MMSFLVRWSEVAPFLVCCVQVLGSQLRILSASPEDSGEYICRVQGNPGNPGSHVHQASVSVSVTSSSSRKLVNTLGLIQYAWYTSCLALQTDYKRAHFNLSFFKCPRCTVLCSMSVWLDLTDITFSPRKLQLMAASVRRWEKHIKGRALHGRVLFSG